MFDRCRRRSSIIRSGKLRALAVTTATRCRCVAGRAAVAEFVPGYEASAWYGIGAPESTPAEIVDKLNAEINAGLADPKIKARLVELGGVPTPSRPPTSPSRSPTKPRSGPRLSKSASIKPE